MPGKIGETVSRRSNLTLDKRLYHVFYFAHGHTWGWLNMNRRSVNPNITAQGQAKRTPMKPWKERLLVGIAVAIAAGGILAWSDLVIRNNESAARIEAHVQDMNEDLDNFINLRYQADIDRMDSQISQLNERIDRLVN